MSEPIRIKTNAHLFDECKRISRRVEMLSAIVQNDMEVTEEDLNGWIEQVQRAIADLKGWGNSTYKYVKGLQ